LIPEQAHKKREDAGDCGYSARKYFGTSVISEVCP
jgi:hypothetical protein